MSTNVQVGTGNVLQSCRHSLQNAGAEEGAWCCPVHCPTTGKTKRGVCDSMFQVAMEQLPAVMKSIAGEGVRA